MRTAWVFVLVVGCGSSTSDEPPGPDAPVTPIALEDIATGLDYPGALAVDDTHVYVTHDRGTVSRIPKAGGSIMSIAVAQRGPTSLDASTARLCWVSSGTHAQDFLDGSIRCAPKTGGADTQLSDSYFPSSLAIHGNTIYWTEIDGERVRQVDLDGTNPQTLDNSPTAKIGIAATASHLAWTASGPGNDVVLLDRTSGAMSAISTTEYSPSSIHIAGNDVYWVTRHALSDDGAVRVVYGSRRGGTVTDIASAEYYPSGLVIADGAPYWTSNGRIRGFVDGAVQTIVADRGSIGGFVADAEYFYWTEPERGAIVRIRRGTGSGSQAAR